MTPIRDTAIMWVDGVVSGISLSFALNTSWWREWKFCWNYYGCLVFSAPLPKLMAFLEWSGFFRSHTLFLKSFFFWGGGETVSPPSRFALFHYSNFQIKVLNSVFPTNSHTKSQNWERFPTNVWRCLFSVICMEKHRGGKILFLYRKFVCICKQNGDCD